MLSVRVLMEQHRQNPACASCHKIMDPLGFSLENFDGIGQWRTKEPGGAVDASGQLADGSQVDGPAALRKAILAHPDQFVDTMTEKLLTYALAVDSSITICRWCATSCTMRRRITTAFIAGNGNREERGV